jgi:short-subunit dehydrogenase
LPADLSDADQVRKVEAKLADLDRPIDLLVNNAGGHRLIAPFVEHDTDHLGAEAAVNAFSVLRLTHVATKAMVHRGAGNVVQVSAGTAFYRLYANEWGERVRILGGRGRLGQVTPPAWRSTRRR